MKKLRVTVDGKAYEVLVETFDESDANVAARPFMMPASSASTAVLTAAPAAAPAVRTAAGANDVVSPLSGKVVSIDVKVGQAVAEAAQVATVEAMKMNTYIYAPKAGKVTAVIANPGDAVDEGGVLLRID